MDNSALVCPWIKSMSGFVLNVVPELVRKFHFCHEGVGCNVVGEYYRL